LFTPIALVGRQSTAIGIPHSSGIAEPTPTVTTDVTRTVKDLRRFATSENALARSWPEQYCFLSVTRASLPATL
jgi:hypothetical protein